MNEDITKKHIEFKEMLKELLDSRLDSVDYSNPSGAINDIDHYYNEFEQYIGMCNKSILDELLQIKLCHPIHGDNTSEKREFNAALFSRLGPVFYQMTTEMMRDNEKIEDEHNE